ncbi:hypothetical protein HDU85_004705 [Gaertneriomyces sp. JEL0708]|nr:hypothetical protein HDU85_004705 [Gaertneriomyces sp. JEL0708]
MSVTESVTPQKLETPDLSSYVEVFPEEDKDGETLNFPKSTIYLNYQGYKTSWNFQLNNLLKRHLREIEDLREELSRLFDDDFLRSAGSADITNQGSLNESGSLKLEDPLSGPAIKREDGTSSPIDVNHDGDGITYAWLDDWCHKQYELLRLRQNREVEEAFGRYWRRAAGMILYERHASISGWSRPVWSGSLEEMMPDGKSVFSKVNVDFFTEDDIGFKTAQPALRITRTLPLLSTDLRMNPPFDRDGAVSISRAQLNRTHISRLCRRSTRKFLICPRDKGNQQERRELWRIWRNCHLQNNILVVFDDDGSSVDKLPTRKLYIMPADFVKRPRSVHPNLLTLSQSNEPTFIGILEVDNESMDRESEDGLQWEFDETSACSPGMSDVSEEGAIPTQRLPAPHGITSSVPGDMVEQRRGLSQRADLSQYHGLSLAELQRAEQDLRYAVARMRMALSIAQRQPSLSHQDLQLQDALRKREIQLMRAQTALASSQLQVPQPQSIHPLPIPREHSRPVISMGSCKDVSDSALPLSVTLDLVEQSHPDPVYMEPPAPPTVTRTTQQIVHAQNPSVSADQQPSGSLLYTTNMMPGMISSSAPLSPANSHPLILPFTMAPASTTFVRPSDPLGNMWLASPWMQRHATTESAAPAPTLMDSAGASQNLYGLLPAMSQQMAHQFNAMRTTRPKDPRLP